MADDQLQKGLSELFGRDISVSEVQGASGGCINACSIITLSNRERIFVKKNRSVFTGLFKAEMAGLGALSRTDGPRVPDVLYFDDNGETQILILEYISTGGKPRNFFSDFGRSLALLHKSSLRKGFGFEMDNHIGSTKQINPRTETWLDFFKNARLIPQIELAKTHGRLPQRTLTGLETLIDRLGDLLPDSDTASLIHGDLWGGNYMCTGTEAVLIDPAVSYSHREADLAMTQMFGGFSESFYSAYNEVFHLETGYAERVDLYNIYHVLNHLNLFGGSYLGSVQATLRKYGCY